MAKSNISVGVDTPTGEPVNAPRGPYVTDEDEGQRTPEENADTKREAARKPKPDHGRWN